MKIIEPSSEMLDRTGMSISQKIEAFGRVSYQSQHKIEPGSDLPFLSKVINVRHMSVLEGACVHLRVNEWSTYISHFIANHDTRFFNISHFHGGMIISGTVRAFMERLRPHAGVPRDIAGMLYEEYPDVFPMFSGCPRVNKDIEIYTPKQVTDTTSEWRKHLMVAVRFIISRDTSHELVRHRPGSMLQESQRYCGYDGDKFGGEVKFIRPIFFEENTQAFTTWKNAMALAESAYLNLRSFHSPQAARKVLPNSTATEIVYYTNLEHWRHIWALRTSSTADPSIIQVMRPLRDRYENDPASVVAIAE